MFLRRRVHPATGDGSVIVLKMALRPQGQPSDVMPGLADTAFLTPVEPCKQRLNKS